MSSTPPAPPGRPTGCRWSTGSWPGSPPAGSSCSTCGPGLTHLQLASLSFDVCTADVVRSLGFGGRLVLCPRELLADSAGLFAFIQHHQVNFADFVPAVLVPLLAHLESSRRRSGRFRNADLRFGGLDAGRRRPVARAVRAVGADRQRLRPDRGGGGQHPLPAADRATGRLGRPGLPADRQAAARRPGLPAGPARRTGAGRGGRRAVPGRGRGGPGLPEPAGADRAAVLRQPVRARRSAVPDRRPGSAIAQRRPGVPRPARSPGQAARAAGGTGRGRGGAGRLSRGAGGGGDRRRATFVGLLPGRSGPAAGGRGAARPAGRPAAGAHGAGRLPAVGQLAADPERQAGPGRVAGDRRRVRLPAAGRSAGAAVGRAVGRTARGRPGRPAGPFLRPGWAFAAGHAVGRAGPPAAGPRAVAGGRCSPRRPWPGSPNDCVRSRRTGCCRRSASWTDPVRSNRPSPSSGCGSWPSWKVPARPTTCRRPGSWTVRWTGPRCGRALDALVARHEALRTRFAAPPAPRRSRSTRRTRVFAAGRGSDRRGPRSWRKSSRTRPASRST